MFGKNKSSFMEDCVLSRMESLQAANRMLALESSLLQEKEKLYNLIEKELDEAIEQLIRKTISLAAKYKDVDGNRYLVFKESADFCKPEIEKLKSLFVNVNNL